MKERAVLELIEEIADAQFHKTRDKWWKKVRDMAAEKKEVKRWWQN